MATDKSFSRRESVTDIGSDACDGECCTNETSAPSALPPASANSLTHENLERLNLSSNSGFTSKGESTVSMGSGITHTRGK